MTSEWPFKDTEVREIGERPPHVTVVRDARSATCIIYAGSVPVASYSDYNAVRGDTVVVDWDEVCGRGAAR